MKLRLAQWASPLIITGGVVILLVLAVFLVNRENSASVAAAAETSIVADNTLSAVSAVRTTTVYAFSLAALGESGDALIAALDGLEGAAVELATRVDRLAAEVGANKNQALVGQAGEFIEASHAATTAIRSGERELSSAAVDDQATALGPLTDTLVTIRDENINEVLIAGRDVGKAAQAVRFVLLFFLPLAMIIALWRAQRRLAERKVLAKEVEKQTQIAKSRDNFVADVSHELRTPLTGIYGFALALEENATNLSPLELELVSLIINESAELTRMVDDLVAIGRIDAGALAYSFEEVNVTSAIFEVMKPFERMGITFEYESFGMKVYADRARLRQILRNLLSNAVKYGDGQIAINVFRRGHKTIIEVIDNGSGVPDVVADRLFERYVHSGGAALLEGSVGLGLAIAQSFTEGMNGNLSYQRVDDLTVFQLELPALAPAQTDDAQELAGTRS